MAIRQLRDWDIGEEGESLRLLHLHPHILQQLVVQGIGDIKLDRITSANFEST